VLKEDSDVYDENGALLLRFRKNVLSKKAIEAAFQAMESLIEMKHGVRQMANGGVKSAVKSNVIGYMDGWNPIQRSRSNNSGVKLPGETRVCAWNAHNPELFQEVLPLIKEIDGQYKRLCPREHKSQLDAAKRTAYHIGNTAFSTITVNNGFRTSAHMDSGDWTDGFGNLVVIERGAPYSGAYTGFPQYGIGVDVRNGDFLAMDVHRVHANTPFHPRDSTSKRISLVCYLRENIVKKSSAQKMYDPKVYDARINRVLSQSPSRKKRSPRILL